MQNLTEEFRRQPPAPLAPRPLNIPTPEAAVLDNGLRVVVVETPRLPLVSFRLALRTGDAFDPPEQPGLTDVLTNMLTEGTRKRSSRELAAEVARLGASLSSGATSDYTTVAASALSAYADRVIELLAEAALEPSFPEDELELTRQNSHQNLIAQRGQASFLATERVARVLYGDHPYSVVAPTHESIDRVTRDALVEFHRAAFVPNNAVLVVVGDVRAPEVLQRVRRLFGDWRPGEVPSAHFPAPPKRERRTLYVVDRPESAQSNIVVGNVAIRRTDPDYFPMLVMHTVLGATASSRLFMNLREEKGYTYGAYTSLDARRTAGTFRATAEVRTPVTGASLKEFFHEFERIRGEDVSDEELNNAKTYLTGIFPIRLETQEGLIDQLVQIEMHGLPEDYLRTYRDRINAVTREEVRHVANLYVDAARAAVVVVGDAAAVRDQLAPFADDFELYDSAGRRKEEGGAGAAHAGSGASAATRHEAAAAGPSDGARPNAEDSDTGEHSNMDGTWNLEVNTPFGKYPATLVLESAGGTVTGSVRSQLGVTALGDIKTTDEGFEAKASHDFRGQTYHAQVTGRAEGDALEGTIKVDFPLAPAVRFTGTRAV